MAESTYQVNGVPLDREQMFLTIQSMLASGQYQRAAAAFDNLLAGELGGAPIGVDLLPLVDNTKPVIEQARVILHSPESWVTGTEWGSKTKTKYPKEAAVQMFQSLPLTHDELLALKSEKNTRYLLRMLYAHPNWDEQWVRDNVFTRSGAVKDYLSGSRNMKLTRELLNVQRNQNPHYIRYHNIMEGIGEGDRLDEETLIYAVRRDLKYLLSNPKISLESLSQYFSEVEESSSRIGRLNYHDLANLLNNPNVNDDLRGRVFAYGWNDLKSGLAIHAAKWENANPTLLEQVFEENRSNADVRLALAHNPHTSARILTKLAQSVNPELKSVATARLEARAKRTHR